MKKRVLCLCVLFFTTLSLFATKPTVALVLSGGGAKGLAHIAVIEAVEKHGIPIDMVVGTSMGALVGSLYSAGYSPKEMRSLAEAPNFSSLFVASVPSSRYDIAEAFEPTHSNVFSLGFDEQGFGSSPGLLGDQMVMEMLSSVFSKLPDDIDFDELEIPFRCVGADVVTGEKIVYEEGSLITAVRSSISIPIIFSPHPQKDGRYAIDGGIVDNLPVQLAKDLGYDIVIACDVNASMQSIEKLLGSLSSMVMQTMTLVTQIGSVPQHQVADLLICPSLPDILALDFMKYKQIIEEGERASKEKEEQFIALANRIALDRPLQIKDTERDGTYLLKSDPRIRAVRVVDVSLFPSSLIPQKEHFSAFVGRLLDPRTQRELSHSLVRIQKHYRLSSATYQMASIQDGSGDLVVTIQSSKKSVSNISLGLSGSTGIANNTPNGDAWLSYDARLNARISNVMNSKFSLDILATVGQTSKLRTSLLYPLYTAPESSLDLDFSLAYEGGGFTPRNSMVNGDRVVARDKGFSVNLSFDYRFLDYGRLDFGGLVDMFYLYNSGGASTFISTPILYASLVWDTQLSTFASVGVRGEFSAKIGYEERPIFGLQAAWMQRFSISEAASFGYDLHVAMMRMPFGLLPSYVDIGGLRAFPGYSRGSLHRDVAMAGVLYQHAVGSVFGFPSFVQVAANVGIFDTYNPYMVPPTPYPLGVWFSSTNACDAGVSVGLGLETPLGDVIVRFGATLVGQLSLAIEIL